MWGWKWAGPGLIGPGGRKRKCRRSRPWSQTEVGWGLWREEAGTTQSLVQLPWGGGGVLSFKCLSLQSPAGGPHLVKRRSAWYLTGRRRRLMLSSGKPSLPSLPTHKRKCKSGEVSVSLRGIKLMLDFRSTNSELSSSSSSSNCAASPTRLQDDFNVVQQDRADQLKLQAEGHLSG